MPAKFFCRRVCACLFSPVSFPLPSLPSLFHVFRLSSGSFCPALSLTLLSWSGYPDCLQFVGKSPVGVIGIS